MREEKEELLFYLSFMWRKCTGKIKFSSL